MSMLDVILRVPPLFIMDAILLNGVNNQSVTSTSLEYTSDSSGSADNLNDTSNDYDDINLALTTTAVVWFFVYFHAFVASVAMFLLPTRNLMAIYTWLTSIGAIFWSLVCNEEYLKLIYQHLEHPDHPKSSPILSSKISPFTSSSSSNQISIMSEIFMFNKSIIMFVVGNMVMQNIVVLLFCATSGSPNNTIARLISCIIFLLPTIASLFPGISTNILSMMPTISAIAAIIYLLYNLARNIPKITKVIYSDIQWARSVVRHYGLYTLIENQWSRLHVPQVLRVFWLTRLTEQAVFIFADHFAATGLVWRFFEGQSPWLATKTLLIRGCETVVAVLGMTSILSSAASQIGSLMQSFLLVEDPEDRSIGTVSAILFFILALQTGLTGMEPEKRFMRLYRNVCLLLTAILHFIHNMVSPLLFSLSASRNMSINRHGRALTVCILLIIFPCWFLYYLWSHHSISTWLLAVSAFSIEVVIKVIISLLIYGLFMIDAFRSTMWEQLDDYVYYIRATGNTVEFIFGIFLFFNGAWILLFESGGTIRALMMCIHAYFNIWLQAKAGWKTFMKRRSAVYKINSLPEATPEQLARFDDVCAICYQTLNSARITKCNHYFHGVCLRKWLYVQDICPLCHENLSQNLDEQGNNQGGINEQQDEQHDADPHNLLNDNHAHVD